MSRLVGRGLIFWRTVVDKAPSIAHRLQARWARLAERLFGDAAGSEDETARGEFTSAFISQRKPASAPARQTALQPPASARSTQI
jgi:hypothetical protein